MKTIGVPVPNSRKAWSFFIFIAFLVVITIIGAIAIAFWGIDWQFFTSMAGIGGMGETAHQASQNSSDKSPNYNPGTAFVDEQVAVDCVTMVPKNPPPSYSGPLVP